MGLTERVAARYKEAATEITVDEIPEPYQKFMRELNLTPVTAHRGIHGYIIVNQESNSRFSKEFLKKLLKNPKFRWIEFSQIGHTLDIGME